MDRGKRMLNLVLNKIDGRNVKRPAKDVVNEAVTEKENDINVFNSTNRCDNVSIWNRITCFDQNFVQPVVENETATSNSYERGIILDNYVFDMQVSKNYGDVDFNENNMPCSSSQIKHNTNEQLNVSSESRDSDNDNDMENDDDDILFSSFDDMDNDPSYKPTNQQSDVESIEENEHDSSIEEMGQRLEYNLTHTTNGAAKAEPFKSKQSKRNTGKEYFTVTGKRVPGKNAIQLGDCRMKCNIAVSFDDQKKLFAEYWNLGQFNLRVLYMTRLIEIKPKNSAKVKVPSIKSRNRLFSYKYYVEKDAKRFRVCQKCFKQIFNETDQFIKTVISKKCKSDNLLDQRGRQECAFKISEDQEKAILDHIQSFPAYEGHYTRRDSSKKYLQGDLNLSIMYRLYCDIQSQPVSITTYKRIFRSLNLGFKKPKLDLCSKCELLATKIKLCTNDTEKEQLKLEKNKHVQSADNGYEAKRNDKGLAKSNATVKCLVFDLQQCLPTPLLRSSIFFYKRPLWTFNLTIHDLADNQPYCMMWHEAIANRGANEIASCLFTHIKTLPVTTTRIILYSDCCPGQNRNSILPIMFSLVMVMFPNIEVIDHKFLIPGHTHLECDSDHAVIERKKKVTSVAIEHPHDWYNFIKMVGVKKSFAVTEMTQYLFKDFGKLLKEKFCWRKKNTMNENFIWRDVRWLRYTKLFGSIQYKTDFDEDSPFKEMKVDRRGINSINETDLKACYDGPIKSNAKKKKDLLDLLNLINPIFHDFYKNLLTNEEVRDIDPDLGNEDDGQEN